MGPGCERRAASRSTQSARDFPAPPGEQVMASARSLPAVSFAVPAPRPAAGPPLAILELLLGPANAAFSGHLLLGIFDPADELVPGQRRDVIPRVECGRVGKQRLPQVCRNLVDHPTGHSLAAHDDRVSAQGPACLSNSWAQRHRRHDSPREAPHWRNGPYLRLRMRVHFIRQLPISVLQISVCPQPPGPSRLPCWARPVWVWSWPSRRANARGASSAAPKTGTPSANVTDG